MKKIPLRMCIVSREKCEKKDLFRIVKIPDNNGTEITRKLGGEEIDKAFIRWLKFKKKGSVIYTYLGTEEENK